MSERNQLRDQVIIAARKVARDKVVARCTCDQCQLNRAVRALDRYERNIGRKTE